MDDDAQRQNDLGMVDDANEIEEGLDDWEMNFVEDMNKWLRDNPVLTEKQRARLKIILEEKG